MKYLLITFGLILSLNSLSQAPVAAVELTEHNVLYRGFENRVIPAVTHNEGQEVGLIGTNSTIRKIENQDYFYVKLTGKSKTETLHVVLYEGSKVDTVKSMEYRVANLPVPYAYWGGLKSGGFGNITSKKLSFDYPEGVPLKCDYRIVSWEINAKDQVAKGMGNDISSAEKLLKNVSSGTILLFTLKVISPDGIMRMIGAQWEVKSWKEEVNMNPLGFDRE